MQYEDQKMMRIADLILAKRRGRITASEQSELDLWVNTSGENKELFRELCESDFTEEFQSLDRKKTDDPRILAKILANLG